MRDKNKSLDKIPYSDVLPLREINTSSTWFIGVLTDLIMVRLCISGISYAFERMKN